MLIYILFIIGFFLLIKGADLLVDGSSSIAKKLKIPDIVIGLTIVAFGTSMPEFVVNIFSAISGNSGVAIGNVLGSNTLNILLILGLCAIIYPIKIKKYTTWKEMPYSIFAVIILFIIANDKIINQNKLDAISRGDGLILLGFFLLFLIYIYKLIKKGSEINLEEDIKEVTISKSILFIIVGLVGLILGGKWIIDGAVNIATILGISQSVIGLTIIAIGTSLPELATSLAAAKKKKADIIVGNIIGSNLFNIFWVLGASALINPLSFNTDSNIDIFMAGFASLILFIFMFIGEKHVIQRYQGVIFVLIYVFYIIFSVIK